MIDVVVTAQTIFGAGALFGAVVGFIGGYLHGVFAS
jgi:hypothetical protein